MINSTSRNQRLIACPSSVASCAVDAPAAARVAAPAGMNSAPAGSKPSGVALFAGHMGNGMGLGHAKTSWLGGISEFGCAISVLVTKRITTGRLREVLT